MIVYLLVNNNHRLITSGENIFIKKILKYSFRFKVMVFLQAKPLKKVILLLSMLASASKEEKGSSEKNCISLTTVDHSFSFMVTIGIYK